jgi:tetrahydromethanopterin S-methyltransferase subunit G
MGWFFEISFGNLIYILYGSAIAIAVCMLVWSIAVEIKQGYKSNTAP